MDEARFAEWAALVDLPTPSTDEDYIIASSLFLSEFWDRQVNRRAAELEDRGIPWERAWPMCLSYYLYTLDQEILLSTETPVEVIAADGLVAEEVEAFIVTADYLEEFQYDIDYADSRDRCREAIAEIEEVGP